MADIARLEEMAAGQSFVHRLDPRTKVVVTAMFLLTVVVRDSRDISGLLPLTLYPVALAAASGIPFGYLLGKIAIACPFAVLIGMWNPIFDRRIVAHIGSWGVSGGMISFGSILARFVLTISAAIILVAVTGFDAVCSALSRLRVPRAFVVQLNLLYRYIFVLARETSRMMRAYSLRNLEDARPPLRTYAVLMGHLLLRAIDRAQRIHMAMLSRGFDGEMRMMRPMKTGPADLGYILFWLGYFTLVRLYDVPALLGNLAERIVR
jgi:cobalt/nickel transport system permease protein